MTSRGEEEEEWGILVVGFSLIDEPNFDVLSDDKGGSPAGFH